MGVQEYMGSVSDVLTTHLQYDACRSSSLFAQNSEVHCGKLNNIG